MSNQKSWNKIKTFAGIIMCAIAILTAPCLSFTTYAAEATDVETCADIKEWMWKIEDGKLYKRLYNSSTGLWETDWIYVCDYPEGI